MPTVRRIVVGLTVAGGLAATALALPAGAGPRPLEFTGIGRSTSALPSDPRNASPALPAGTTPVQETGPVTITGSVGGLYPGATLPLPLTIANARTAPVTVTSVTATVADASKLCKKANLTVSQFAGGDVVVPAGGHAIVTLAVTMALAAGNTCQGAVFHLTYHGKATTR
jgi:hypothetical protein